MAILIDTNVLLRAIQPEHPMHGAAVRALQVLIEDDAPVITLQNVAEFWNTITRPAANNGLGLSVEEAKDEVSRLEHYFPVLCEDSDSYNEWKALVGGCRVVGVQVHDARLVAVMKVRGIPKLLTFNVDDFARYAGIEAVHPEKVSPKAAGVS